MSSMTTTPCAACKLQRRKCMPECVFSPYFPPDQPQKFENVHRVFGASNVAKILNDLGPTQREDAVNSLAYEAEARLRDPVYGCVGLISILQHRLKQVQFDLYNAKKELSTYIGPSAMLPILPQSNYSSYHQHQQQQQQMVEAQQLVAVLAAREQMEALRCDGNNGVEPVVGGYGFDNQMAAAAAQAVSPALGLDSGSIVDNGYQIQRQPHQIQLQIQPQPLIQQQQSQAVVTKQERMRPSEEGRNVGPAF